MMVFSLEILDTPVSQSEKAFNVAHRKTRVLIEQAFGRWKRRFHVLHSEIRMSPERVCKIIGACAVLHNIAIFLNEPMEDEEELEEAPTLEDNFNGEQRGLLVRNYIRDTYFD